MFGESRWQVRYGRLVSHAVRAGQPWCPPEARPRSLRWHLTAPVPTSRSRLPQRPGRVRGLAGPDGGRDAVHLRWPVPDQDRPYVAVVQDGATPAPCAGKPQRAAAVSTSAVITDLGWVNW